MQNLPSVPALLAEVEEFGAAVSSLLSSDAIDWHHRPTEDAWSPTEIICHLRDVEREVHQPRFRDLIAADNVFLPGSTSDEWVEARQYHTLHDGRAALVEYLAARRQTVVMLHSVDDPSIWERRGRHTFFGPTSMHELLNLVVQHDRAHWQQIAELTGFSGEE